MEEKKADNRIIQVRKELSVTEDTLTEAKDKLRGLDNLEENFSHLNKNITLCVELLASSIKNKKVNQKMDYLFHDSKVSYMKSTSSINDEKEDTRDKINDLNDKIDELNKIIKEELNKEEPIEEIKEENKTEEEIKE